MREIKFRVWDDTYKYMNYKVLVGMWGNESFNDENYTACSGYVYPENVDYKCDPHWAHFEPYMKDMHLMQYTGLKDKNGKEIYEGDIVKNHCGYKATVKYGKYNYDGIIHTGFYIEDVEFKDIFNLMDFKIEVIGNIYENKELLDNE